MQDFREVIDPAHPKHKLILVTGHPRAGKTAFLAAATGHTPTVCDVNGIMGVDHAPFGVAYIELVDDHRLWLVEVPGPSNSAQALAWLGGMVVGVVILLDNTRPEYFLETRHIFKLYHETHNLPCCVALYPQTGDDAWSDDDLRPALRVSDDTPIVPMERDHPLDARTILRPLAAKLPDTPFSTHLAAWLDENE